MQRWIAALFVLLLSSAYAQQPANPTTRVRGSVESYDGKTLVIKERSGEIVRLALAENFAVNEVVATDLAAIQPNSFVGIASMPATDGTLKALEVLVFPEAARGTGEGHYPWDLKPGSMMTNATVGDVASVGSDRKLQVHYKGGEKTIIVPTSTPIVTFKPGDPGLLVAGAKVVVMSQVREGKPTAVRALAGRNGFTPPM